jgi:hypothetical protein
LRVLIATGEVSGNVFKEAVVQANEQAKEEAHLRRVERCRGMFHHALEGDDPRLALFLAPDLLGLVLLLLTFVLGFVLLFPLLPLSLVLGHPLLVLGPALCRFFLRLLSTSLWHGGRSLDGLAVLVVGVYRVFIVKANRHRASNVFAEYDDGGFGPWARPLCVGIVGLG